MGKKVDLRLKLIEVAREVFCDYGFRKATMDDIASRIGKRKSFLYYYFENKEAIYKAVLDREEGILWSRIHSDIMAVHQVNEKLKAYITSRLQLIRELHNFREALRSEDQGLPGFISKFRRKMEELETELVSHIFHEGIRRGEIKTDNPGQVSLAFLTAVRGIESIYQAGEHPADQEARIEHLVNIFMYGISRE